MKKTIKKVVSLLLVTFMVFGSAPLAGFVGLELPELNRFGTKAEAATITSYKQGDIIEFGWYPQSEVADVGIISELNSLAGDNKLWTSYDYYSGTGRWYDGQMKPGDYMRYKDVVYGSNKYRGVVLDSYRPYYTGEQTTLDAPTDQYGYYIKTIYWFKYEPVKWRVLDPATGMVMSETIIDSQAYNNFVLGAEDDCNPREYYGDREMVYFANNYAKSSIREWLNKDFYNTAFSTTQQRIINHTSLENSSCCCSEYVGSYYNSETTCDRIYLPSYEDLLNPNYGFSSQEDEKNVTRIAQGSDYSLCQGLLSFHPSGFPWLLRTAGCWCGDEVCYVDMVGRVGAGNMGVYCTYMGIRPALNFDLTTEIFQSDVKDTGKSSADGRGTENSAGDSLAPDFVFSNSDYTQTHVVDNFLNEYDKYENEYFSGCGIAMDGTSGSADLCVPGLTKDDNMVPQGIAYYPQKDWILISAYSKNENVPSVIYALDKSTGKYVAQFDVFKSNGDIFKGHFGGIAVSNNNLYFSNGKSISYIPLSEFNVAYGTKKIVEIEETQSLAGLFGDANISYVSFSNGVLYAGNFYNETEEHKKPIMQNLNSIVIGYKISGEDSESEWKGFVSKGEVSDYNYSIPNAIDEIQCALVKDGKLYLSCSYGRKNDSRLYVVEVGSATDKTIDEADFSCLAPPMMEGITFIGDELYAVFESGAYFYREKSFYNKAKNPTDVVWKIDCESLMSENTTSSGDCKEYNVLYGDGIIPVNLKQSWFRNDSLQYKHELAQLCSKFATLGYNTDSLKSGLNALGFNPDRIFWETKAEKDKVDTFIADRSISVDGETYTLLFVGCIGTNTVQWVSNFEPGTGETHASFNAAKNYVYESLEKYIVNNKIDTSKLKILLCGHSRGAATANILAAKLIDEEILTTKENIYTYTFATPNPTSSENRFDEKYNRIFNFVNPEDFVTKVIPAKWGYGRYGRTFTLPSLTNTVTYINLNKRMQDTYDIMMKHSYHPYPGGEYLTYNVVNAITSVVKNIFQLYSEKFIWLGEWKSIQEFFVESLCSYLANEEGSPERKEAQDLLLKTFLVRTSSSAILSLTDYFVHYQGIGGLTGGVVLDDYFQEAHQAVTYCAYMMSMTASQAITERKAFMNTVNCPVDIEVYNKATGELVGKIVNNVIDEEVAAKDNAIVMNVNGDSKSFWLPSDGEFDVRLSGNDNGTMDYSVSAIDSADSSEIQRVNFFDVAVEYGATMSGEFSGEDFSLDEYILTLDDNNSIEPDEKLDESELQDIFVNVITEGIGYTDGNITVTSGDYVTVTATTDEGNSFIGWYENDVLVSAEAEYSFVAKENRNLVAKFTNNYSIQWNVDGEITETYSAPGTAIIMPESPEKEGYRFIGWTPEVPSTMPSNDLTFTAVYEATGPVSQDVVNKPSQTTISYGDAIILHIDASMIPAGGRVEWTASNNNFSYKANGATCEIHPEKSGDTTFTATVYDANGNAISKDEQTMTSKAGFFDKIIAFFKGLFGLSKTYPNVFKGIF